MEPGARRRWTPDEKLRIVIEGLRGDQAVAEVCRKNGVNTTLYYTWKDKLLQRADRVFEHANHTASHREQELEQELAKSKEVVNELVTEVLELKKTRLRSMMARRR